MIQVASHPPPPPPPPLNSVGCYKSNTFYCTYFVSLGTSTLLGGGGGGGGGGWGKNLVEAEFMSVYRRLAVNSIEKQVKKGEVSQNLVVRIVA